MLFPLLFMDQEVMLFIHWSSSCYLFLAKEVMLFPLIFFDKEVVLLFLLFFDKKQQPPDDHYPVHYRSKNSFDELGGENRLGKNIRHLKSLLHLPFPVYHFNGFKTFEFVISSISNPIDPVTAKSKKQKDVIIGKFWKCSSDNYHHLLTTDKESQICNL